ncbi:MAG: DUF4199 domain-containing protein [Chitinophagales bacterium]|nr:DUF4199 domain-containing protein [Bacteroidota bacterium]MCB9043952.1 DUF4199 domain-containing protein [Chitinophagales bacterium]
MKPPYTSIALRYGLIAGLAGIILSTLLYFINPTFLFSYWILLLSMLIIIGIMVMAVSEGKKANRGMISFGDAFVIGLITFMVAAVVGNIFQYILFNFIDPSLIDLQKQMAINNTIETMKAFGADGETIDKTIEEIEKQDLSMSFKNVILGILSAGIFGAIIAAIVAAILKRERKNTY